MKVHDPGQVMLRRAGRAAVVQPITYAVLSVGLHEPVAGSYAAFAVFTLLVFADFGGRPRDRAFAYLLAGGAGVPLVAIGSLLSGKIALAVIVAFVITFAITFAGVLRGYVATASSVLLLPLVLAMTSTTDLPATGLRCLGWALGVLAATVGALVLWPTYEVDELHRNLGKALEIASVAIRNWWTAAAQPAGGEPAAAQPAGRQPAGGQPAGGQPAGGQPAGRQPAAAQPAGRQPAGIEAVITANDAVRSSYDGVLLRPAASTSRDRALMLAVNEMNRLTTLLKWPGPGVVAAPAAIDQRLAAVSANTLAQASAALAQGADPPSAKVLDDLREEHELKSELWVRDMMRTGQVAPISPILAAAFQIRMVALSAQSMAANVAQTVCGSADSGTNDLSITLGGQSLWNPTVSPSILEQLRAQFRFSSPWFRNALRCAAAVGIAVLLVLLMGIAHGFWVVLGTLAALRFDASGTRRCALDVLTGTVGGFAVSIGVVALVGNDRAILFVLLPITVFLAAYTPSTISLAVGQGAFTVFAVVLFALAAPSHFTTAEYRLLDLTIAVAVSLVVSALMWPRGIARLARDRLDKAVDAATSYFVQAFKRLTRGPDEDAPTEAAQVRALREQQLAAEILDLAISQATPGLRDVEQWRTVLNVNEQLIYAADLITIHAAIGRSTGGNHATRVALVETATSVAARLRSLGGAARVRPGDQGANDGDVPTSVIRPDDGIPHLNESINDCLLSWHLRQDPKIGKEVTALVWAADWLIHAAWLADRVQKLAAS